jgi:hypothetical protein
MDFAYIPQDYDDDDDGPFAPGGRGDYDSSLPLFSQEPETADGMPRFDEMIAACLDPRSDVPLDLAIGHAAEHLHEVVEAYLGGVYNRQRPFVSEGPCGEPPADPSPDQAARIAAGEVFLEFRDSILSTIVKDAVSAAHAAYKHRASQIKNAKSKAEQKAKKASAASDLGASKLGGAPATSVADQEPGAVAESAESTGTKPASADYTAGSDTGIVEYSLKTTTPTASQDIAPTKADSTPMTKRVTSILSSHPAAGSPQLMTAPSPQPAAESPPTTRANTQRLSPRTIVVHYRKGVGGAVAGLVA